MGGGGTYLRLKKKAKDDVDLWRYRTNAIDAVDYFQSSLITDVYTRYLTEKIEVNFKNNVLA
ncbi:hypothetical protein ES705_34382 [subsurface metagenome]